MIPTQAKNMQFTTRYPVDKIVGVYPGSFTANASSSTITSERTHKTIPHTFGTTCFLELIYSLDGGTTWQDMDMPTPNLSVPSAPVFLTVTVAAYSTTTDFVIVAANQTTSSETVQYILTATWKD
jgi:hypothetical protein